MKNGTRLLLLLSSIILVGQLGFVACKPPKGPEAPAIRVGFLNIVAGLPLLVASEEGLFAKKGLNVQLVEFRTGNEVATAAVTRQVDVIGGAAANAVLDSMQASGKTFRLFLANEYALATNGAPATDILVARKEIKSLSDLEGKTVGIYPGSVGRAFAKAVFPRLGLPLERVKLVEIPAAQMLTALSSGSVDAVTALEPQASAILSSGEFTILVDGYYAQVMPKVPASGSWFIAGALTPQQESNFHSAMVEAVERIKRDRPMVNRVMTKRMSLDPTIAAKVRLMGWSSSTNDSTRQLLNGYIKFLQENSLTSFKGNDWIWNP